MLVEDSESSAFAMGSGVFLTALSDSDNNVIKIGNTDIEVQVLNAKHGIEAYGLTSSGTGDNNKIIMGNGSINITANSVNEVFSNRYNVKPSGIAAYDNTEIKTGNVAIVVTATGNENIRETVANGIIAEAGEAKVTTLNGSITATAINTADGATYANAILAGDGSNVTKSDGNITAVAEGEGTLAARGVNLWSDETITNLGVVDISAKTIGGSTENGNWIDSIGVWTRDGSTANIAGGSMNPVRKRPIPRRRSPSGALGRINGFASVVSRNPIVAVVLPLRSRLPGTPCWIVRSIARLPRLLHPDSSACGWG